MGLGRKEVGGLRFKILRVSHSQVFSKEERHEMCMHVALIPSPDISYTSFTNEAMNDIPEAEETNGEDRASFRSHGIHGDDVVLPPREILLRPRFSSGLWIPFSRTMSRRTLHLEAESLEQGESLSAYLHEAVRIASLGLPLIASQLSGFFVSMVSLSFVGRDVGKVALSAAVLGTSVFNVTGLSLVIGSLGALETLAGQAFGRGSFAAVGLALQRSLLGVSMLSLLVVLSWMKVEPALLLLGQNTEIAHYAAKYVLWSSPALPLLGASECLKRFLMAQKIVAPAIWAALAALIASIASNHVLVTCMDLGLSGAALANVTAQFAPLIVEIVWVYWHYVSCKNSGVPERSCVIAPSSAALLPKELFVYARLSAPSMVMVMVEWWAFESCVIMSGWLPNPETQVAVMGLALSLSGLLYMLPLGLGSAASVRVGNALGAGLPHSAHRSAYTATGIVVMMQLILCVIVLATRNVAGYLFTEDSSVAKAAAPVLTVMAFCLLGDGLNALLGGVLRGSGRQDLGAIVNLSVFWLFGLPLAGFLGFHLKLGVVGLFTGLTAASLLNVSFL